MQLYKKATLAIEKIDFKFSPNIGLPPSAEKNVVGEKLKVDVKRGTAVGWEQFE